MAYPYQYFALEGKKGSVILHKIEILFLWSKHKVHMKIIGVLLYSTNTNKQITQIKK